MPGGGVRRARPSSLPLAALIDVEMASQGLTLERLARLIRRTGEAEREYTRVSAQQLCRWRNGEFIPTPTHLRLLATALRLPVALVTAAAASQRRILDDRKVAGRPALDASPGPAHVAGAATAFGDDHALDEDLAAVELLRMVEEAQGASPGLACGLAPSNEARTWQNQVWMAFPPDLDKIDRRDFFRYLSVATTAFLAGCWTLDADEIERQARVIASPSRLDEAAVQHLEQATELARRSMVEVRLPTRIQVGDSVAQMKRLLALDLRAQPESLRRRLVRLVGEHAAVAGWLSTIGLWDFTAGSAYLDIAHAAAREAAHRELEALVLGYKSYLAMWEGKPADGLQLAETGLKLALGGATATTRARLATASAEMYAINGQGRYCWDRFEDARKAIAELGGGSPSWIGFGAFDEFTLAGKEGAVLLLQGRARDAVVILNGSLAAADPSHSFYADSVTNLASAYVHDGGVAEGCDWAMKALSIASQVEAGELVHKVKTLYEESAQHFGNNSVVRDLGDYVRAAEDRIVAAAKAG